MDPLSVAASIVALVSATSKICQTLNRLWDLRKASEDVLLLANEVTDLQALLDILHDALLALDGPAVPPIQQPIAALRTFIDRAVAHTSDLDALLSKIASSCSGSSGAESASSSPLKPAVLFLQWAKHEKTINRLRRQLHECRFNIQTALTAINTVQLQKSRGVLLAIQEVTFVTERSPESQTASPQPVDILHQLQKVCLDPTEKPVVPPAPSQKSPNQASTSEIVGTLEVTNSQTLVRKHRTRTRTRTTRTTVSQSLVRFRAYPVKNICNPSCPCHCHVRSRVTTPPWLQVICGSLFFGYTSTPSLNMYPCNYLKCRRRAPTSLELVYVFPSWMVSRAVQFSMMWSSLQQPTASMNLQVSNVIPLSSPILGDIIIGDEERVRNSFSQRTASPFDVDPHGRTLLHWAMDQMQPNVSRLLMETGADPFAVDSTGRTPLDVCWERCLMRPETESAVVEMRAICESIEDTPNNGPQVQINMNFTDLHMAVLGLSHTPLSAILDRADIDIDAQDKLGRTALFWAASRGTVSTVRQILQKGADPNKADFRGGQAPLHAAAAGGLLDRVLTLLGASDAWLRALDLHPGPPLSFVSVDAGPRAAIISLLVEHGADINAQNTIHNNTPLHQAILLGILANVKALVELGADIEIKNINGDPPLSVAIWESQLSILQYLLARGARVDYRTAQGDTILHIVARTRHIPTMRALARRRLQGVDAYARNAFGQTAAELFQSFHSTVSLYWNFPDDRQRDAWDELLASLEPARVEEVGSEDGEDASSGSGSGSGSETGSSSGTEHYVDAVESLGS
ncbi:hypothetical protein B0T16DRAFT_497573 [Cercophora newfieldiana]|uniref:Ankyrin repeat protein n=1 Tax=Cercophora newfieldiana TaxID=92897 RepID=A0AA39XTG2_9PEZI|nr:hypothetical protein B0T16DRAFT_497573 [Cercophora newfieldiana]